MSKTVVIDSAADINYLANVLGDAISGRYGAIDKVEITVLDFGTGGVQFATNGAISNVVGRTLVADSGPVPDQTNGPGAEGSGNPYANAPQGDTAPLEQDVPTQ